MEDLTLLYEAAVTGCITTLNNLIQRDQLILNKVSLTNFTETPLHISSLAGHIDFSKAILQRCPKMASESDSFRRLPIHLASAERHVEITKALLFYDKDVCLARDKDGRIPLHLASMRERVEVIQELVSAYPESIAELLDGDSVFHSCVKYNHLEALKLLVDIVNDGDDFLNKENQDGNTIFHLAAILKEFEIMKYLLSLSEVRKSLNAVNKMEFTALDLIHQFPLDLTSVKIQDILREAGAKRAQELKQSGASIVSVTPTVSNPTSEAKSRLKKFIKFLEYDREETRGALMVGATVIATMTYQAAMNPPGGVWQQNFFNLYGGLACSMTEICEAGTSILGYAYPGVYKSFLASNTVAFFGCLCVITLVFGGFPLRNKFCVWLLARVIGVTIFFLAFSYIGGVIMVTPAKFRVNLAKLDFKMYYVWTGMLSVIAMIETVRIMVWTAGKLPNFCFRRLGIRIE